MLFREPKAPASHEPSESLIFNEAGEDRSSPKIRRDHRGSSPRRAEIPKHFRERDGRYFSNDSGRYAELSEFPTRFDSGGKLAGLLPLVSARRAGRRRFFFCVLPLSDTEAGVFICDVL